jgi:hypothetical protein
LSLTDNGVLLHSGLLPSPIRYSIENFLENGRISESDWWEYADEGREIIARPEEVEVDDDEEEPEEEEEQDEYEDDNDQASLASAGGSGATPSSSSLSPSSETSSSSSAVVVNSGNSTKKPKKFVNQGLALWVQGREAWQTSRPTAGATPIPRRRDPAAIPDSFKKELVKCLGDRRHFELSQRIPLSTMIEAYQVAWENERNNE